MTSSNSLALITFPSLKCISINALNMITFGWTPWSTISLIKRFASSHFPAEQNPWIKEVNEMTQGIIFGDSFSKKFLLPPLTPNLTKLIYDDTIGNNIKLTINPISTSVIENFLMQFEYNVNIPGRQSPLIKVLYVNTSGLQPNT